MKITQVFTDTEGYHNFYGLGVDGLLYYWDFYQKKWLIADE